MALTTAPSLALPLDATCLECGYQLRELTVARCPECGRAFDPADPMTMDCPGRTQRLRRTRQLGIMPPLVFATTTVVGWLFLKALGLAEGDYANLLIAAAPGLWARAAVCRLILSDDATAGDQRDDRTMRRTAMVVLALGLLLSASPWSCPHGYGVRIGPMALTWTGQDGMCHNHGRLGDRHQVTSTVSWYWAANW